MSDCKNASALLEYFRAEHTWPEQKTALEDFLTSVGPEEPGTDIWAHVMEECIRAMLVFGNINKFDPPDIDSVIGRNLTEWSGYAQQHFRPGARCAAARIAGIGTYFELSKWALESVILFCHEGNGVHPKDGWQCANALTRRSPGRNLTREELTAFYRNTLRQPDAELIRLSKEIFLSL
ncbi:MAG: hypothetical protein WDN10_05290 [bacterium]